MAEMGYCPSGRLFEAAACGAPILSDWWEGLDRFYEPGREILIAKTTDDAVAAIELSDYTSPPKCVNEFADFCARMVRRYAR